MPLQIIVPAVREVVKKYVFLTGTDADAAYSVDLSSLLTFLNTPHLLKSQCLKLYLSASLFITPTPRQWAALRRAREATKASGVRAYTALDTCQPVRSVEGEEEVQHEILGELHIYCSGTASESLCVRYSILQFVLVLLLRVIEHF